MLIFFVVIIFSRDIVKDKFNTYIYSLYDDFDNFLKNKKINNKLLFIEDEQNNSKYFKL